MPTIRHRSAAFALLLAGLAAAQAHAGASLQDKGKGLAIASVTVSRADRAFDAEGKAHDATEFRKEDYEIYAEYGLAPRLTATFDTRATTLHPDAPAPNLTGMGETQLGLRG